METKDKIVEVFIDQTAQNGFTNVRVSNICKELNIERKLFYYYFEDKYSLLSYVYQIDLNNYFGIEETDKDNWHQRAQEFLSVYHQKGKFYINSVFEDDYIWNNLFLKHMTVLFKKLFASLSAQNLDSEEVTFFAEFYANGWTGIVKKWIKQQFDVPEDKLIKQFDDLIDFTRNYIYNW